jgi:two-component system cell cycle response regulator
LACRFGGEEFVVVMPETELELAIRVGERIRSEIATEPFVVDQTQETIDVTVSVGVAALEHGDSQHSILKRADRALYAAKREGRNRVTLQAA